MLIKLLHDWYAPNGKLYRKINNPHSIPPKYKDQLPSSAIEVKEKDPDDEDETEDYVPVDPKKAVPTSRPSVNEEDDGKDLPGQVSGKRK